jgi:FkbM family methyltransferase
MAPSTDRFAQQLLAQSARLPYFPGKWRLVEPLVYKLAALRRGHQRAQRLGALWDLDLGCFVQRTFYYVGWWEREETRFLLRRVEPGWSFVDGGAYFGYFTVLMARRVGPTGRVYSFEPSRAAHAELQHHCALNGLRWVRAYRMALGEDESTAYLTDKDAELRGARALMLTEDAEAEAVPVTTLDAFVAREKVERIDAIKVDIEGSESRFLRGAAESIRAWRPLLMLEVYDAALARSGSSARELIGQLDALAYDVFRVRGGRLHPLERLPAGAEFFNVIALPRGGTRQG